jgi:hypothetical protein
MKKSVRNSALALALALTAAACFDTAEALPAFAIECGQPCATEGQESYCVDRTGTWRKVTCYCLQGYYRC